MRITQAAAARPQPIRHYRGYAPRPFRREERDDVTILFGGLTWKHERLVQAVFENLGYRARPLPNPTRADLDRGKALVDVGACCPTTFVTGNLANFLDDEARRHGPERTNERYVYLTAGACGACRFGQYHQSYTMALDAVGLGDFRVLLMNQDEISQVSSNDDGLSIDLPFTMGLIWALHCGDLLTDLEYATRPFERHTGQTDETLRECVDYLHGVFRDRPVSREGRWGVVAWHVVTGYFARALREVRRRWDRIEVDRLRVKPRVKVTGEFWLQTHEGDGNYDIKRWLEREGAEVVPPPIAVWLDYWMRFYVQELEDRRHLGPAARAKIVRIRAIQALFRSTYHRLRRAVGGAPARLPDQYELRRLAAPYFHRRLSGGEGDMLVGKTLYAHRHKIAHMICELSPYSCMPNTMSVGAMAQVLGDHPDLLYAPIEIKGDSELHALSRCQMILTEAHQRAAAEFESAMASAGLTASRLRDLETRHTCLARATCAIPHGGFAGTAANYATALGARG